MINDLALTLRAARRKAGLTQSDVAHLLEVHPSKISLWESGKARPSIMQVCRLSVTYGVSFEILFSGIFVDARRTLRARLKDIPEAPRRWLGRYHRDNTLRTLERRLNTVIDDE